MRSRGISGRIRQVIKPDSSSHQPDVKLPTGSEMTAALMRVIGSVAEPVEAPPGSPAFAVWRSAAPMTISETSSPTVAERPESFANSGRYAKSRLTANAGKSFSSGTPKSPSAADVRAISRRSFLRADALLPLKLAFRASTARVTPSRSATCIVGDSGAPTAWGAARRALCIPSVSRRNSRFPLRVARAALRACSSPATSCWSGVNDGAAALAGRETAATSAAGTTRECEEPVHRATFRYAIDALPATWTSRLASSGPMMRGDPSITVGSSWSP